MCYNLECCHLGCFRLGFCHPECGHLGVGIWVLPSEMLSSGVFTQDKVRKKCKNSKKNEKNYEAVVVTLVRKKLTFFFF
jgi:hypothetical protein